MKDPTPQPPGYVEWAARTLEEGGYETWAVGGAIRNTLLGIPAGDWDLATRAPPTVVQRLFPRTIPVGVEHGTVGVLTRAGILLEVTTFRKDVLPLGRKAVVEFAETLDEDLSRRDFTVNAIAWHPLRRCFRDPFGGREDLETGRLRTVGDPEDRFSEDLLRVLRALRFAGRFRLAIDERTWTALRGCTEHLGILSPERVREELMKVLSQDPRPSGALSLYGVSGVLGALYPELEAIAGETRGGWVEGTEREYLWTHSLLLADALPAHQPLLRLAALLQGIGIPKSGPEVATVPMGPTNLPPEDILGRNRAAALMLRLRFSNAEIREVTELVQIGLEPPVALDTPADLRRWLYRASPDRLLPLARIWIGKARLDRRRKGIRTHPVVSLLRSLREERRSGAPLRREDLAFDGRHLIALGLRPGPRFKDILDHLMETVLKDPEKNRTEILRNMAERFIASDEGDRS